MKVNVDAKLLDLDGDEIPTDGAIDPKTEKPRDATPVTLKAACLRALCSPLQEDQGLAAEEAFRRLELARTINKGGEVELLPADAVLIQNRAAKVWVIEIAGQVYEMLKG